MAEVLQGKITLVHTVQAQSPTAQPNPTEATTQDTKMVTPKEVEDIATKGMRKMGGMVSIQRRLANYAMTQATRTVNQAFDNSLFRESLFGDKRSMRKIQNQKATFNAVSNIAKSGVGSAITSAAMGNPAIIWLWAGNTMLQGINNIQEQNIQRAQFEDRRDLEMYVSNKRRERVIVGTYNRR